MNTFTEAIETAEKKEFTQDEVLDWLESVYNFCIPENKEAGEHAFNVLDYYYMEELGAHIKRQYSELATLRAQLAEAREALEPFAKYGSKCTEYEESTWEFRIKGRHFAKALKIYNELVTTA